MKDLGSASCPQCGALLQFRWDRAIFRVCDHCRSALVRKGVELEAIGTVATLVPTPSLLRVGLGGRLQARGRFTIAGRLQLDWGKGTWDEWYAVFDDGSAAWISESMGRFHVMLEVPAEGLPEWSPELVGRHLGGPGGRRFTIVEARAAHVVAADGDLPGIATFGREVRYADAAGPDATLATIDYGAGVVAEAFFVGREVAFAELGFAEGDLATRVPAEPGLEARALECPNCAGALDLRVPDETQRVGCPRCGSLLDASQGKLAVLSKLGRITLVPLIPLGSEGVIDGVRWTVTGVLEKVMHADGETYTWREYLLHERRRGYRFLTESGGHWSLVEAVSAGDVVVEGNVARHGERTYKHFQSASAKVGAVLGEFYWKIRLGQRVPFADFTSPPWSLSEEREDGEITWSRGRYVPWRDVAAAFGREQALRKPEGVFLNQPNPHAGALGRTWLAALLAFAAILAVMVLSAGRERIVFDRTWTIDPNAPHETLLTEPFVVKQRTALELRMTAPVSNSWVYVEGALIDEDRGRMTPFDVEVGAWAGPGWSEGSQTARDVVSSVEPGTYLVRLDPSMDRAVPSVRMRATSGAVPATNLVLALIAVLGWPLVLSWMALRFENKRWNESDHAWLQES